MNVFKERETRMIKRYNEKYELSVTIAAIGGRGLLGE